MVALSRGDVGGWAGVGGGGLATAATSLEDRVECEREWEAGGKELLTLLIKNNRINLIIFRV